MTPLELIDRQTTIIKMQADIIDELFVLLMQHISAEDADALPVIKKINTAAKLWPDEKEMN